jgi:hypothetical protein
MAKRRRPPTETPTLFALEPESPQQETPAPLSPRDADQFVDQFMYLLTAPYMFFPLGGASVWEANDNKTTAKLQRLMHAREIFDTQHCTEFEAMLYISTVTLAHPLSHDWFTIYMWLFRRWATPEQAAAVGDDLPEKLNPNQSEDLARLRGWIFKTQMNHMKAKMKGAKREEVEAEGEQLEAAQPKLF